MGRNECRFDVTQERGDYTSPRNMKIYKLSQVTWNSPIQKFHTDIHLARTFPVYYRQRPVIFALNQCHKIYTDI
jgi:hypothetical protein